MQPWSQPLLWPAPGGAVACDPYFGNVVLLDGFNGVNGATATTDESPAAHGAATFSGVAQLSSTQTKFGTTSLSTGTGSLGLITWPGSNDWYFSNGKFTIEFWVYPLAYGSANAFLIANWNQLGTKGWALWYNVNTLQWQTSTTGSDSNADIAYTITGGQNVWHFYAIDNDGTKIRLYIDGVMVGSTTTIRTLFNNSSTVLSIGSDAATGYITQAYIDEVRITKGVARYASDAGFAVPTAAFPRVQC